MSNPRIEVDFAVNVAGVASGVSAATSELDKLGKAAQSTAPKFEQLSKSTSRYNTIGIDFARIIQDAPFGIIGVGNNITQLAQSFSGLGNSGDSLSSKLKLAFGQILSSGNLLILGVSAITTIWTLYEKGVFKSEEATKSLSKSLDKYRENLDGIAKANLEGIKNAQSEIANFKLLQAQAENTNISYGKRIEAVEKLKKQYPDYLKNLTDEQILTGNVGTAYDNLTASIIATAKAKAFQSQIGQNALNQATLQAQIEENLLKIQDLRIQKADVLAASEKQSSRDKQDFLTRAEAIQRNINNLEQENKKNKEEIKKLDASSLKLAEEVNEKVKQGADFVNNSGKEADKTKEAFEKWKKEAEEIQAILDTEAFLKSREIKFDLNVDKFTKLIKEAFPEEKEVKVKIKTDVEIETETADQLPFEDQLIQALNPKRFTEFEKRTAEFATNIRDLLQNNVTNAFIDLGYTIGETLANGGNVLKAIGGSLLKSFARFLGQFGEQLIAYGVAATAFGKVSLALATPGGALIAAPLAIAAGIALTAIAGAIGGLGKKGPGGGGGGGGAGGGSAATGTSFVGGAQGGLFAQNRDLNGELVVRGQDLVYVFNQASDRINKG